MRGTGGWLAVATVALLAGCGLVPDSGTAQRTKPAPTESATTSPAPEDEDGEGGFDPSDDDEAQLEALVDARADAVLARDEAAWLATVDPDRRKLVKQQRLLFRNLVELAPASLDYQLDLSTYLVPNELPGDDPTVQPVAFEHVTLDRTLRHPLSNQINLTFVRRDGTWLVGAELGPGDKGAYAQPQERPWFGGAIAVLRDGALLVVGDRDREGQLPGLVTALRAGLARDADLLGLPVDDRVLVDTTSNGVPIAFRNTSKAEAAAVTLGLATLDLEGESTYLAGVAIKVNPDRVEQVLAEERILWHELAHFLLQRHLGASPPWLTEGVASWVEWQPYETDALVVPDKLYQRLMTADRRLPSVVRFDTDPTVHYLVAQSAVEWLVDRGGAPKVVRLMRAYLKAYDGPNTDGHTAQLLRQVYGVTERELVRGAWERLAELQH